MMGLSRRWQRVWCLAALVSTTACASAPPARSFADVPGKLDVGTRVTVTATDAEKVTGHVETLHAQALALVAKDGTRHEFPPERIERITRRKRHLGTGVAAGLGAGLAVGLIDASASDSTGTVLDAIDAGVSVAAGLVLGAAVGAVVGWLVQTDRTVYLAPAAREP